MGKIPRKTNTLIKGRMQRKIFVVDCRFYWALKCRRSLSNFVIKNGDYASQRGDQYIKEFGLISDFEFCEE